MKRPTNQQIVGGYNRKEKWAFELIYDDYEPEIFDLALRILKNEKDARDLSTEIFINLRYDNTRRNTIKKIHDVVNQSTKHMALDWLKKRRTEQKYVSGEPDAQSGFTEAEITRNETGAAIYYEIERCKHKLTPQCGRVFDLFFMHQKSIPEIAEEMNISIKTVSNNKTRALKVMKLEIVPRKPFIFLLNLLP